jgi:putative transposase
LLKIDAQEHWLWVAYEPDQNKCLAMHISRERTILVSYQFFKNLRKRYGRRKPIFTEGALWYNTACRWLRLKHQIYSSAMKKNMMKRFVQYLKDRTECFDDHFPYRKPDCDRQHVWNWLKLFMLYLRTGMNRNKFTTFLVMGGG